MATSEVLTEREQQGLEHMRKAQELGVTLKEYAARRMLALPNCAFTSFGFVARSAVDFGSGGRESVPPPAIIIVWTVARSSHALVVPAVEAGSQPESRILCASPRSFAASMRAGG
jgi:hypothetical protein